jgi:AcrR family transcriptional regulator
MSVERGTKRKYELKQRADEMARTRTRITEAAVQLHGTVGPARTTISAIAEQAGVQRHTVYRHFPSEADLYGACSAHYFTANPLPDPEHWRAIDDPRQRLSQALDELYAYYERTEAMFANVFRDLDLVDALQPTMVPLAQYLAQAAEILATGRHARGRKRRLLTAALGHVLDFHTWQSLTGNATITRTDAVHLSTALVDAAATRQINRPPGRGGRVDGERASRPIASRGVAAAAPRRRGAGRPYRG